MHFNNRLITKSRSAQITPILLLFSFLIYGCGSPATPEKTNKTQRDRYFDLKAFMDTEAERLSQKNSFVKKVSVNGEQEEKHMEHIDFKNELRPFFDSDINKPAWSDKYDIDSTFNQLKELTSLFYKAKDEKLKTQRMSIDFEKEEVSKIFIENATNTNVAKTHQSLIYRPKEGFSIESKQDVALMDENHFKIEVDFH